MRRDEFEHVVRAAAEVVEDEIVVVGSQAVLGQHPDAPASLLRSLEVDLYPRTNPARAAEVDGALGDGSRFHETYGYYAHGVGPETSIAPAGWQERLIPLRLRSLGDARKSVTIWCLETHDLFLAKLAAGRPHDLEFAVEALQAELVDPARLELGVDLMPERYRDIVRERLDGVLVRADPAS